MRVIGVLDLLGGRAVHARAGDREHYDPVRVVAGSPIVEGDAEALARAYVLRLGLTELYAADLDAILGRAPQDAVVAAVARVGAPLWLDSGISSTDRARHALDLGAAHVVVGLETLESWDALSEICDTAGGTRVAFSLDLRDGEPIVKNDGRVARERVDRIAARASEAGAGAIIVLDLACVGTGRLLNVDLIGPIREAAPDVVLIAGGGVHECQDFTRLAGCGCDGVLVATALHEGRIGRKDVAAASAVGRRHANESR